MSITFALDDVVPAGAALPTRRLADAMAGVLALGGDGELPVVDHGPTHPLLGAVHLAFAQHRPLVLTPDAVWITIAQGVGQHVRLHAEALRPRLVRHADTKKLIVEWGDFTPPTDAASWASIVTRFSELIAGEIGDGPARLLQCDFSTTTEHARVASQVVLMDTYAPYFDYEVSCVCGIPAITLRGTVEDWRSIRRRIDVIAELDLGFWTRSLVPIADQLVRAAAGDVDLAFWRRIYKPRDAYGGEVITGWIARLYPYLSGTGRHDRVNPLLDLPIGEPRDTGGDRFSGPPGIRSSEVGGGLSTAIVHVNSGGERIRVDLDGGLVGVSQGSDGALEAVCGWALRVARGTIHDVVERLRAEHTVTPRRPGPADRRALTGTADLIGLYDLLDEATLFATTSPWRILPRAEHETIELVAPHGQTQPVERLIDLADGTCIALHSGPSRCYVRVPSATIGPGRREWVIDDPGMEHLYALSPIVHASTQTVEETPVVATSLTELLTWALDHDGSTDLPVLGHLVDHLEPWQLAPPPPPPPPEPRGRKKKRGR